MNEEGSSPPLCIKSDIVSRSETPFPAWFKAEVESTALSNFNSRVASISLARLKIGRNELSRVGEGAFKEVPALQSLDLGGNRFRSLDQETFAPLPSLESLNLAGNQLEDINGLLQAQTHLKWLNVSGNRLAWFDFAFVPPSVEWLDVAGNRIDALGNYYNLLDNYRLRYFDASRNRVRAVGPTGLLPSMEHVFLADNLLETVEPGTFVGKYSLRQVHLQGNRLESLDGSSLTVTPQTETPVFYLSGNPLVCDCRLQWLKRVNAGGPGDNRFPRVADLDGVRCRVLNHTGAVEERPVSEVGDRDFLCEYEKHCLPGCMCCDFFACDCQMKCPEGCRCYRDGEWAANVAQCSSAGFGRVPEVVPMDATVLYLDGNNLTELTPGVLVGRSRLRRLSAREAGVARIANQSFAGLVSLQVLDLGRNQLKTLAGYEFSELRGLRELHLDHNQLVSMAAHTFRALRHLTVLTLHGNLLISFPIWQLSSNPQLKTMTLADNWWQCDCDFVRKFRMFIDGNMDIIPDASRITCTSSSVDKLNQCSGVLSGGGVGGFRSTQGVMGALVPLAAGVAALAVVAVVSLAAAVKMRGSLLVWLHYKYGIRLTCGDHRKKVAGRGHRGESSGDEGGGDLFDALVLYSTKDESLVQDELVKQLEPSYRLCLLHRDLSGIYTSETFKSALSASSRVIVVFSQGLFAGEWEYVSELGLQDCLIVVAGDMAASEVEDRAAKDMLRRARKVLEWGRDSEDGRQIFWRKLKYHLPDPSKISGREGGAELDISGVWTFTPMEGVSNNTAASPSSPRPPKGANDTNASTARLLCSPADSPLATRGGYNGRLTSSSTPLLAANLASAGNSPVLLHFPAPPVRKQPHQCSTHYLAGAPSSSSNNSSLSTSKLFTAGSPRVPAANPLHQRSMSNEVYPAHHLPPNTRSCGTNAVHANAGSHHHQRSVSAIDDGRKALVAGLPKSRSIVCGQIPPTPPPKIRHKNSFYNFQSPQQAQPQPESIYNLPRSSILQQLVSSSSGPPFGQPSPELLLRPQPVGQAADPQEPSNSSSSLAMIPLRAAAEHPHRRSSSLLDHQVYGARQNLSGSHHLFAKQQQSTALARRDPPPPAPHRRSASGIGVNRTASMLVSSEANNVAAHHKSALNLMARKELLNSTASPSSPSRQPLGGQQQHNHARSRSTPFKEGFVL